MKPPLYFLLYDETALFDATFLAALKEFKWVGECTIVRTRKAFSGALPRSAPHAILVADGENGTDTGFTALVTAAREYCTAIPVIVVVEHETESLVQKVIDSGANDYLLRNNLTRFPVLLKAALQQQDKENETLRLSQALKKSNSNYDTIFLKGPLPKWIYDIETLRFLEVNEAAVAKYGYSREEFLHMTLWEVRPTADWPLLSTYFATHPAPIGIQTERWRHCKKNGEVFWVETIAHSILFDDRKARMVTLNDVTELQEAQQKIKQSEANLKIIFDNTSEGFLLLDEQAKIVTFNNSAEVYTLIKKINPFQIGSSIYEFLDRRTVEAFQVIVNSALQGSTVHFKRYFQNKDNTVIWLEFSVNPVYLENVIKGVCVTGRNITSQKLIEDQREFSRCNLKALINNTDDFMWSIDRSFHLITSNEAFSTAFKTATGKEAAQGVEVTTGKLKSARGKTFKDYYQRALNGESFTITSCVDNPFKAATDVSFYPIYKKEEVVGAAIFSRDVSQRIQAEEVHQAYTRSLEEMLFKISHHVRVPIANLIGLGHLAKESNNTEEELKVIMGYIQPTITVLDTFSRDLTRFIEEILLNNKNKIVKIPPAPCPKTRRTERS